MKSNEIILCGVNSRYIHSSLAIHYLAENIKNDVDLIEWTINKSEQELSELLISSSANVICFSCYIWNIEYITNVIRAIRIKAGDKIIILGGPQVSYTPDMYIESGTADYVVSGEGELPFAILIEQIFSGEVEDRRMITLIDGVSCRGYISKPYFDNSIPISPYKQRYIRMLEGRISYIETVRGCPFGCTFCLSGRKEPVKYMPMEQVKRNILTLANSGTKTIKFVDRSFNANEGRAKQIVKFIIEEYSTYPVGIQFHFEIAADVMSDDLVEMFCTSHKGLFRLEIGIQSLNHETLSAINRKMNIEKLKRNIRRLQESGSVHLHLDLIAGLPFEGVESLKNSFNAVMRLKPNVMQLGFLKLLPGSPMSLNPMGEFRASPPYEVIKTEWITYEEISRLKEIEHLLDKVYNSGRFSNTLILIKEYQMDPYLFFERFYDEAGVVHGESYNDLAKRLIEFYALTNDKEKLYEAMREDMRRVNPVGRLPGFLKPI